MHADDVDYGSEDADKVKMLMCMWNLNLYDGNTILDTRYFSRFCGFDVANTTAVTKMSPMHHMDTPVMPLWALLWAELIQPLGLYDQAKRDKLILTSALKHTFQNLLGRTTSRPRSRLPLKYIIRPRQYSEGSFWSIITYQIHTGPYNICGSCQYTSKQWYSPSGV